MSRSSGLFRAAWLCASFAAASISGCGGTDGGIVTPPPPPHLTVTATDPFTAARDITLNVRVLGSGFVQGSRAVWRRNGDTAFATTRVKTNSTSFVSAVELLANIKIEADARLGAYDLVVVTPGGGSGIGSGKFGVRLDIEIIDLGAGDNSTAAGVNNLGQIVGTRGGEFGTPGSRAFLWENGTLRDLGVLPGMTYSAAEKINESGQVVGASGNGSEQRAFVWTEPGGMQALSSLGGSSSDAHGINDHGDVAGASRIPGDFETHAVVWRNGVIADLEDPSVPSEGSRAWSINILGEVVGRSGNRAFVWKPGRDMSLLDPAGNALGAFDNALDIDDGGRIVGWRRPTGQSAMEAYLWTAAGFQQLGMLSGTGSVAWAINGAGQVVGGANGVPGFGDVAFIWTQLDQMQDLGLPPGAVSAAAVDINDNGWVVGFAGGGTVGASHAVLWKVK